MVALGSEYHVTPFQSTEHDQVNTYIRGTLMAFLMIFHSRNNGPVPLTAQGPLYHSPTNRSLFIWRNQASPEEFRSYLEVNAMAGSFSIGHVVAVASKHPFYSSHEYPLRPEEVTEITAQEPTSNSTKDLLSQCPIIQKEDL